MTEKKDDKKKFEDIKLRKKYTPDEVNRELGAYLENINAVLDKRKKDQDDFTGSFKAPDFEYELIKVDLNKECKNGRYKLPRGQ